MNKLKFVKKLYGEEFLEDVEESKDENKFRDYLLKKGFKKLANLLYE